ncbi:hypothetical protein KP509_05G012800 [Ceratopteris richardii]|uniref:Rhodanese domain-containing protein n=1 Tax=Ceratopteris richardii TaxID=49495 RepID=A0A8T2UW43_CERRI|nr:hypothetical protein KP509_05G012800 [Ceratopteris richardii]
MPSRSSCRLCVINMVDVQQEDEKNTKDERFRSLQIVTIRGWLYNKFIKDYTMKAKLGKFKFDVASRDSFVDSLLNDAFRYTAWIEIHRKLTKRNLESISCKEIYELVKSNKGVIIDVREPDGFAKVHVENAKSDPLFGEIQGNDVKGNLSRLGYAMIIDFASTVLELQEVCFSNISQLKDALNQWIHPDLPSVGTDT